MLLSVTNICYPPRWMDLRSEGDVLQVTTADTRNLAAADYESLKTLDVMGVCWSLSTDDV